VLLDADADGRLDAVTADFSSRSISIRRGLAGPAGTFRRGDADRDGALQITDAIVLCGALFLGDGPLPCEDAADTDDDGAVTLTDAVAVLARHFQGGAALPAPGAGSCGPDPRADDLPWCPGDCP
jgi:hypothetical protein